MPNYEVRVPFTALRSEHLGVSSIVELPETFAVAGLSFRRKSEGKYFTQFQVPAQNMGSAQESAIDRVHKILWLLAIEGEAYRVNYSEVFAWPVPSEDQGSQEPVDNTNMPVSPIVLPHGSTAVAVIRARSNFDRQSAALSQQKDWPSWFPTILELNYLAVTSHEVHATVVIHYTALEILTNATVGKPTPLLPEELRGEKSEFRREIGEVLKKYQLDEDDQKRILEQVSNTNSEGSADRIVRALRDLGVVVKKDDVIFVGKQRGAIVHSGRPSSEDTLWKAASLIAEWIRASLLRALMRIGKGQSDI